MNWFILFLIIFLASCSSNKSVYWCGDHACVNKKERQAYFKKTMTVEIKENVDTKKNSKILKKKFMLEEKERIKNEKEIAKQIKLEEKERIKNEKEIAKQLKLEEKEINKNEKKIAKQFKTEEKSNKKKVKKENITNNKNLLISSSDIDYLKNKVIKQNKGKSYPDINNAPE